MASIDPEKPVFSISVAADIIGVHPRTLRIYEQEDLIDPSRTPGSRRRYSLQDLQTVRFIRHLTQEKGVNLAGIRIIMDMLEELEKYGADDYIKRLYPEAEDLHFGEDGQEQEPREE